MKKAIATFSIILACIITLTSCNSNEPETLPTGKFNLIFEFPEAEDYPDITLPEKESYSWVMTSIDSNWGYSFDYSDFENPLVTNIGNYEIMIISPAIRTDANTETCMYGYAKFSVNETSVTDVNIKIAPKEFPRN